MLRAFMTGVTGFIGCALAKRLLEDGWEVDALVRPLSDLERLPYAHKINLHRIEDGQDLAPVVQKARPDVVFHLASLYIAQHRADQINELVRSNILLPTQLAEAMASNGVTRLVNTGTAWQNFNSSSYLPVNLYAASKQAADDILLYYSDARDISIITLRLFDTYGPGDSRRKLVQVLIDAARSGETLALSPGDQIVDMLHVDDVVDGFLIAAKRLLTSTTSIRENCLLSGERNSVKELAALVSNAMQQPLSLNFGGRPYREREVMEPVGIVASDTLPLWIPRRSLYDYIVEQRSVIA